MAFTIILQSPDYNGTNGFQLPLPVTNDQYVGDSLAALIPLFDGANKALDFRQYSEAITLQGIFTVPAAVEAGYTNGSGVGQPLQMRDEMIRIRRALAFFGKNNSATSKSWLNECSAAFPRASAATWADAPQPDSMARAEARIRLVYDKYYKPDTGLEADLFAYGTVKSVMFSRPGATTRTRIPFTINFLPSDVVV